MAGTGQVAKGAATAAAPPTPTGTLPHSSPSPSQPLFPRLHVNEGDKGGPRAPPRNKMALYEHLTIPSHRFAPGTAMAAPTQGSGYEGRYVFSSSYLAPTVAYSAVNTGGQVRNQSSAGASNDSAVVDGNKEMQRAPNIISNGSIGMLSSAGVSSVSSRYASSIQTNPSGRKVRDEDNFWVPQSLNSRITSNGMIELCGFNKCQPTDSCSSNPARLPVVTSNNFQYAAVPCSSLVDVREECPQLSETDMEKTENDPGGYRAECENTHAKSKVQLWIKDHREQSKHFSDSGNVSQDCIASFEHLQNSSHVTDVVTLSQHTIRRECVISKSNDVSSMKPASRDLNATTEGLPLLDGRQVLQRPADMPVDYDDVRGADEDGSRQRDDLYPGSSLKNSCESVSEFENSSDGSAAELSVPSQPMQGSSSEDGSDSSMVDSESVAKISPDDVIGAIGKQQFWKARKAILRQQRIFSVQVFELHRLIKVQQLMATSPILLIENSTYINPFGKTGDEKILSDYIPETKTEQKANNGEQGNDEAGPNTTEPADGHILQSGVACYPGWFNHGPGQTVNSDKNGQMYVGSFPVMPFMIPGGMSAWGFPHPGLGTHQWLVPMASHAGEFMHKPFPGNFSSQAAYADPFFGTPGSLGCPLAVAASQGSEHLREFQTRYGLPGSNMQYGAAVCSVPVVAPNLLPACYGLPFPMFYPMQSANVHGTSVVMAHNGATQQDLALNSLESMFRSIKTGQTSNGTPIHCSGVFSHQHQTNGMPRQSTFQDNISSSCHANQTSNELNIHPQSLHNVSIQARGMCGEQLKGECWQLSEGSHFKETNSLVGEESDIQGGRSTDGSERTSKRFCETDMNKCEMTLNKDTLTLFPLLPSLGDREKCFLVAGEPQSRVIKVVPCNAMSAPESAAGILLSIQQERQSEVNNQNGAM